MILKLSSFMKLQEEEIKDKAYKLEHAEQRLATLTLELRVSFYSL